MTDVLALLKTIYLGDLACKSVRINGWTSSVAVEVDVISRIRGSKWNYYSAEDLEGGFLVFDDVHSVEFLPPGPMPDDFIYSINAEPAPSEGRWSVVMEVGCSVGSAIEIRIDAAGMHLEDSTGAEVS